MHEFLDSVLSLFEQILNRTVIIISAIVTLILGHIGYPKEIVILILVLVMVDTISKHYALVVKEYGKFTILNYSRAWGDRVLKSRQLKHGLLVKLLVYLPLLYYAHKASYLKEIIEGPVISNIIYTSLVTVEVISFLENMSDAGYKDLRFLKHKIKKIFSRTVDMDSDDVSKEG